MGWIIEWCHCVLWSECISTVHRMLVQGTPSWETGVVWNQPTAEIEQLLRILLLFSIRHPTGSYSVWYRYSALLCVFFPTSHVTFTDSSSSTSYSFLPWAKFCICCFLLGQWHMCQFDQSVYQVCYSGG